MQSSSALLNPESRKWTYLTLLFSLFYFIPVLFSQTLSPQHWAGIIMGYLAFIGCYLVTVKRPSHRVLPPLLVLLALCFGITAITPGSNALFGYVAFVAAFQLSSKRAVILLGLSIALQCLGFLLWQPHAVLLSIAVFLSIMLFFNGLMLRRDQQHQRIQERDHQHKEQLAAIAERERISRDLHDTLGHNLSSIALKAELAKKLAQSGDSEAAQSEIDAVAQLARQALIDVRESVTGLKQRDLTTELSKLQPLLQSSNFKTRWHIEKAAHSPIPATMEAAIILLAKEACTNILRHSNGNEATLSLRSESEKLILEIEDNGTNATLHAGNGITGMRERCRELGGELQLNSDGQGTRLRFLLPIRRQ